MSEPEVREETRTEDESPPEDNGDSFMLHTGEPLNLSELYELTASEKSRYAVLIGGPDCGKTTLIASMYQMLLQKARDDYWFAGSRTLRGFEERCALSRISSGRIKSETTRTPQNLELVLHLKLLDTKTRRRVNLLMSDISGEDFKSIRGNPQETQERFSYVRAAQTILILLDGEKLASPIKRTAEIKQATFLLKVFNEGKLISEKADILLTISKFDLMKNSAGELSKKILYEFRTQIPDLAPRFRILETAAMPDDITLVPLYYGLEDLYKAMLTESEATMHIDDFPTDSQFERWGRGIT